MAEETPILNGSELEDALAGKVTEEGGSDDTGSDEKGKAGETGEAAGGKEASAGKEAKPEEKPDPVVLLQKQVDDLKSLTLEQKRQIAQQESRLKRLSRVKPEKKADVEEEEEDDEPAPKPKKKEEPTGDDALESEVTKLHERRDEIIETQRDMMSDTEKYKDVDEVCSDSNISAIKNALAEHLVKKDGLGYHTASLEVEKFIFSQKNPYKYLYGLIKEHHPAYAKKDDGQDKSKKSGGAEGEKKEKPKAPGSIAAVPGADGGSSGWTAARIDALPETELHTVPKDIYNKWLANELE